VEKKLSQMAMTVEITDSDLLTDLMNAFARSGCIANRATGRACRVIHPLASNAEEALLEVAFFIRAWQLRHPDVGAKLTP
jgi:hypothetical protein